jgi:hypothetical protein
MATTVMTVLKVMLAMTNYMPELGTIYLLVELEMTAWKAA